MYRGRAQNHLRKAAKAAEHAAWCLRQAASGYSMEEQALSREEFCCTVRLFRARFAQPCLQPLDLCVCRDENKKKEIPNHDPRRIRHQVARPS